MSKLTDLRVLHDRFDVEAVNRNTRSASVSDLVEALQAEGVASKTSCNVCVGDGRYVDGKTGDLVPCHRCKGSGAVLVVPLGEGDAE